MMTAAMNNDFELEKRLKALNPALHKLFTDTVFALQHKLSKYQLIFPEYTDHTNLHSLSVIDFCNQLIDGQIDRLGADSLYILLVSCYFHDTGMGITQREYEEFAPKIHAEGYWAAHPRGETSSFIRDFHHELSGLFIQKYAPLFEIPSPAHQWAIVQVARGHRKTDLMDEAEYPLAYPMPSGETVCLPYLAALLRLADEIDVAADRNPMMLYDIQTLTDQKQIIENKKVKAVRRLEISREAFTLDVDPCEPEILLQLRCMADKMQETLNICRRAVIGRTPFTLTQERVTIAEKK